MVPIFRLNQPTKWPIKGHRTSLCLSWADDSLSRGWEVFVGCKNYTKTLRSKLQKWQSDIHWPLWHRNAAMIGWPVDRLTLTIWGHCVWASESSSAFGEFLDRRDPTDAPDQCLWMCDGSDSFLDIRFLPRRSCPCGCWRAETGWEDAGDNKNDSEKKQKKQRNKEKKQTNTQTDRQTDRQPASQPEFSSCLDDYSWWVHSTKIMSIPRETNENSTKSQFEDVVETAFRGETPHHLRQGQINPVKLSREANWVYVMIRKPPIFSRFASISTGNEGMETGQ